MKRFFTAITLISATAAPALAESAPDVVTDIGPVHSIVAAVMEGVGAPTLLLPPGASPHGYAMRPSDARALQGADLVFWIGPALTPWLGKPIETLARDAHVIALHDTPGTIRLEMREGARFEAHDHGQDHGEHDDDHAKHDDHGHEEHDSHDEDHDAHDHSDSHDDHDDHAHEAKEQHDHADHGEIDAHSWLDPRNAARWAGIIAAELTELDPDNAALYAANAKAFTARIAALETALADRLTPLHGRGFIVFHDAFHYFEARFGVEAVGAIAGTDADKPGAARLRAVRHVIEETGAVCLFTEIQQPDKLARTVARGLPIKLGTLDPLGSIQPPGPTLYPALLDTMATAFEECLSEG